MAYTKAQLKAAKKNPILAPIANAYENPMQSQKTTELLPVNPLLQSPVITVNDENEQKVEMIEKVQSLTVLNKQVLEVKRRQVELEVDNKKLDAANKIIDGINRVADKALSEETITKILNKPDLSPMDLKFVGDFIGKATDALKSLMNPNVADELGNKKKQKINFMFKSTGTVQGAIQIDNSDD